MPTNLTIPAEVPRPQPTSNAIAPAWHTAGVLLLLAGMALSALRYRGQDSAAVSHNRVLGYVITMAGEWLIVGFIAWGARWGGATVRTLAGGFAPTLRAVARDLGIAIAYLIVAQLVLGAVTAVLGHFFHSDADQALKNLVPHTNLELAVYLLLCLTAGICEEMIFRGYFQRQFSVWTGSAAVGIGLQGIVFGCAHAYQGPVMVTVIAVYGCMFGVLTWWRKSLRPGMMAHFLQDGIGGIVLAKFALK